MRKARSQTINKRKLFADLKYVPHVGQWPVHESLAKRRVLACGSRFGKSKACAYEAVAASLTPSARKKGEQTVGWVVAPTYDLADRVFREILIAFGDHLPDRIIKHQANEKKLLVRNLDNVQCEIRGKSADNKVSLLGEGLDWCILDECSRLPTYIWDSFISQRLIDKNGWALMISTPTGRGWFYKAWKRGQDGFEHYESWNMPTWTNPHVSRANIEEERKRLPDAVFRQEYGAEFIEGAGSVFRKVREASTVEEWTPAEPGGRYYAGLDLAKTSDYTVLTIMEKSGKVVFVDRFHRLDWGIQEIRIASGLAQYGNPPCLVDSTGVGEPVYESLKRSGSNVHPYVLSNRSKTALINNLALRLEQEALQLPTEELCGEMLEELEAFGYAVSDSGVVKMEAMGGAHDDIVVSLAMATWKCFPTIVHAWHESSLAI